MTAASDNGEHGLRAARIVGMQDLLAFRSFERFQAGRYGGVIPVFTLCHHAKALIALYQSMLD